MMIIQSNTNVNTENRAKKLCISYKERNEMWRTSYINRGRWKTALHRRKTDAREKKFVFPLYARIKLIYNKFVL